MTPYKRNQQLNRMQRNHNYWLSAAIVNVENVFARIKGRWRRLVYINAYSISKCVEIATAACVMHNICYMNKDQWENDLYYDNDLVEAEHIRVTNAEETHLGNLKRVRIAQQLMHI